MQADQADRNLHLALSGRAVQPVSGMGGPAADLYVDCRRIDHQNLTVTGSRWLRRVHVMDT